MSTLLKPGLVLCFLLFCIAQIANGQLAENKTVVLSNGGMIVGGVIESEDSITVYIGQRSELRLPRDSVDFICNSKQEAYQIKLESNVGQGQDAHANLANWCLNHDMLVEASMEIQALRRLAPADARIRKLQDKFDLMTRLRQRSTTGPTGKSIAVASHQEATGTKRPFSVEDLPNVSVDSISSFTRNAQARLLNGCAASHCHGHQAETKFKLICDSPSRPVTRRMTLENFASCFALIDAENPAESKLLHYLKTPHGTQQSPVYRVGSKHYEAIQQWVLSARELREDQKNFAQLNEGRQAPATPSAVGEDGTKWQVVAGQSKQRVDPFDPEVFNRLHGPDRGEEPESQATGSSKKIVPTSQSLSAPERIHDEKFEETTN